MKFKGIKRKSVNFLLLIILLIAGFLRFYRIREYMTFLGDEGRDVLVVKRMLIDGKFTLLGPITSVGSIYMGPAYYYLTTPFLWLWQFDPVGPAIMVAIFSLLTIYLVYRTGADYFNRKAGLVAAFTYSISRLTITYGRSSWNPNVVPFFALLLVYSLLKVIIDKKNKFLILASLSMGILIQLHYVTFMFFIIIPVIFFYFKPNISRKEYFYSLLAFLLTYSPFLLFELRHGFVNTKGAISFMFENNSTSSELSFSSWWATIRDVFIRLFWRPLITINAEITKIFLVFSVLVYFFSLETINAKERAKSLFRILLIWMTVGVLAFGLYRGAVYDYYLGSLFPIPHLLFGYLFYLLWKKGKIQKAGAVILLLLITVFNLMNSPLKIEPNNMVKNTKTISDFVLEKAGNQPYNFALIATHNSDHAYRYFLELSNHIPVTIENTVVDPGRKTVMPQLLVVCEEKVCAPLGHPLWEIAGFGPAEITGEWKVVTVRVFRLVHYLNKNT